MSTAEYQRARRQERLNARIYQDGRLVNPLAPEDAHGRAQGHRSFGCRCKRCCDWEEQRRARAAEDATHNIWQLSKMNPLMQECRQASRAEPEPPPRAVTREPAKAPPNRPTGKPVRKPRSRRVPDITPPPVSELVRDRITTVETLEKITKAYFEPAWSAPAPADGGERRTADDMEVIVSPTGTVIWFAEREVATGTPEILREVKRSMPKAKGTGGGSRGPTSHEELLKALRASGCTVSRTGSGHIKVSKDGRSVTLPSSASDWRALMNSVAEAKRQNLL